MEVSCQSFIFEEYNQRTYNVQIDLVFLEFCLIVLAFYPMNSMSQTYSAWSYLHTYACNRIYLGSYSQSIQIRVLDTFSRLQKRLVCLSVRSAGYVRTFKLRSQTTSQQKYAYRKPNNRFEDVIGKIRVAFLRRHTYGCGECSTLAILKK